MFLVKSFFVGIEGKSYQFSKTEVINFCLHLKNSVFSTREVRYLVVKFDVHWLCTYRIDKSQTSHQNAHRVLKKRSPTYGLCQLWHKPRLFDILFMYRQTQKIAQMYCNQRSPQNLKKTLSRIIRESFFFWFLQLYYSELFDKRSRMLFNTASLTFEQFPPP